MSINKCPECGIDHSDDYIRCPTCNAWIIDISPWKNNHNLMAVIGALLIWFLISLILGLFDFPFSHVFSDNISKTILCVAIYGIIVTLLKWRITTKQNAAFKIVRRICDNDSHLSRSTLENAQQAIETAELGPFNNLIAYQRLKWSLALQDLKTFSPEILLDALKQHSETDRDSLESSFMISQFLVWLLPTAGFLGTVYGMTQALRSFSSVVAKTSDLGFTAGLSATAQGLGVAFHTTLVGLAAVIPLLALTTALKQRSDLLLESVDKYFLRIGTHILATDNSSISHETMNGNKGVEVTSLTETLEVLEPSDMDESETIESHQV